jgi:malate synthase
VLNTEIQSFSNARDRQTVKVDTCMDYTRPSLTLGIKSIRKSFLDANGRDAVQDANISWTILTAIYNNELVEEPERREIIISNIQRQKDLLLINILGQK